MPKSVQRSRQNWRVLFKETIYSYSPFVRLEKQTLELPDGREVDDYHWLDMPDYCLICSYTIDGQVVTLRGYRHGLRKVASFLPGGLIEKGEDPLVSAKRELLEETGYNANSWQSMGSYVLHGNYGCGRVHLFHASDAVRVCPPNSGDLDEMEVELADVETILSWIKNGRIQSLASVAAITLSTKKVF